MSKYNYDVWDFNVFSYSPSNALYNLFKIVGIVFFAFSI